MNLTLNNVTFFQSSRIQLQTDYNYSFYLKLKIVYSPQIKMRSIGLVVKSIFVIVMWIKFL
jgi:hypothetical protein